MPYFRDNIEECADCPALNQLPHAQRRTLNVDEILAEFVPEWCPLHEGDAVIRLSARLRP